MKKILTLSAMLFVLLSAHAQCPQSVAFDTTVCGRTISKTIDARVLSSRLCGDTIQIVFNAAGTALAGSPKVYLHAGPEFRPFTGWQLAYTVDTAAMTSIGTNLWSIKFVPRNFFHYSADSCLNSIALGFENNQSSTIYVKNGNADIYIVTASGTPVTSYPNVTTAYLHNINISYQWSDGHTDSVRVFTTGGNYTVTATGTGGCTATGYVKIRLDSAKVSLGADITTCTTASYNLTATPGLGTYQWIGGPSSAANTHLAIHPGCYWVKATDSLLCVSYDTVQVHYTEVFGLNLPDTLRSCPGIPAPVDAAVSIDQLGDSIVIVYDATKGQSGLVNDTNIYFHSGPEFHPFQGWQLPYTVGSFTNNDGVGRMSSLGNNKWRIAIDPQCYYGFNPDTPLNGIFMVFRNYNGSHTGKDSLGNNIFVNTSGLTPFTAFSGVTPSRRARGPLSYHWNDGVLTAARTIAAGGKYFLTVSDGTCSYVDSLIAIFSAVSTIGIGVDTTVCIGQHVIMNAGSGYAHYLWSNGDTTQTTNVVNPTTYSVSVTTANGCISTGARKLTNSTRQVSLGSDISRCSTAPTALAASAGFVSYSWIGKPGSPISTYAASNAGCYWVKATDSFGCFTYDTVRVINTPVLGLNVQDSVISCPGNSIPVNAAVSITQNGDSLIIIYDATQGTTGLTGAHKVYMHSGPEFHPFTGWQNNYTVGNFGVDDGIGQMDSLGNNHWRIAIIPQCYYCYSPDTPLNGIFMIFRDANGTHTGKDNANANVFVNMSVTPPTCSFTGVTPTRNATSGVTYSWATPGGTVNGSTVNVTGSGTYIVTASSGLCSKSDTLQANFSNTATINLGPDTTICSNTYAVLNAGAGYTHYLWSNADTNQSTNVTTANTYTVTATNGTGCQSIGHRIVKISNRSLSLGTDIVKCNNTPALLTANSGFASYQWINRAPITKDTFAVSATGCYWVRAIDSFGCSYYDTISVRYSEVLKENLQDTFRTCPGNLVGLDAGTNITLAGDSIVIIYDATQGQSGLVGANKVYMHSGPEFHPFTGWQTQYTVGHFGVDDGIGRMDSLGNNHWRIVICPQCYYGYSPDTPLNGIFMVFRNANGTQTGKDNGGNNIFINLSTASPTSAFNGVTAYHKAAGTLSYLWSTTSVSPAIAVGTTGQYIVTVTDGSNCSVSDTTNVIITNTISVNIGHDTAICPSGHAHFDAGAGFTHYHWSTGDSTQTINVAVAGTYSVTVANGNCSAIDSATVTISGNKVSVGTDITRCNSLPATLTASSGFATYQWFGTGASAITRTAANDGCYWVKATDSAGCTSYDTLSVTTTALAGLHIRDTTRGCLGDTAHFDAAVSINAVGDSLVITYDATQGQSQLQGSNKVYMHSGPEFHPFTGWQGNYTVGNFGQDDGIGKMDSLGGNKWRITICPSCYYHYNPDTPLNAIFMVFRNGDGTKVGKDAAGNNIVINLFSATPTSTFSGITATHKAGGNFSYSWSDGTTNSSDVFTTSGIYTLTATDGPCARVDTVVAIFANATPVNLGSDTCKGIGNITLSAGAIYASYLWNTGASTQTIPVSAAGTYWIRVTNAQGCKASDTIVVATGVSINLGPDTCITLGGSILLHAGSGLPSYLWSDASMNDTLRVSAAGIYWVQVSNGVCSARDSVVITNCNHTNLGCKPVARFRVIDISVANTITIKDSSQNNPTTYYWNFGDGTTDTAHGNTVHTYNIPNLYTVTLIVCDSCGCDTISKLVYVNSTGIANIAGISSVNLYPNPASNKCTISISAIERQEVMVSLSNILGEILLAYPWSIAAGDNSRVYDLSTLPAGMYQFTLKSSSGILTKKLNIIK